MNKRLKEIEDRMAQIRTELENENVDVDALEKEIAELKEERAKLLEQAEKRRALMNDIANGSGTPMPNFSLHNDEGVKDEGPSPEQRAKQFVNEGKMAISAKETRSVLVTSGQIAKPTAVGGINDPFNVISTLLDLVQVEDLTGAGSYKEAYQKSYPAAGKGSDGTAPEPNDPEFRTVAINPYLIDVLTYVSRNIRKLSPLNYEEKVRQSALVALKKKVIEYIVKGNGSTEPFGIYHAVNTETEPESMTEELLVGSATIDDKLLRRIVFAYGGDENVGTGARLFLNKRDLIAFGDVRGTNEKKPVYEIIPDGSNPNTGVIRDGGLTVPYVICSDITPLSTSTKGAQKKPTMIYGAPGAYKLGLFGDYEVRVSEDYKFAEGLLSVKGEVWIGGNVVIDKGFVVVTLAANQ